MDYGHDDQRCFLDAVEDLIGREGAANRSAAGAATHDGEGARVFEETGEGVVERGFEALAEGRIL
jgi:hypothetical protein